ncbi:MAG: Acetyltransferase, GNAT [Candidatus Magasanikbacteria bacterium GW2011_GWC2_37_14]|uniref:Acetyltransferase, GNAT n=1 Tax=Candidatus Magasanikbacteria bacterium GW2011_GWC2_37_14 TaxID=1619046 RepID=A0A0G0GAB3_9BACT|nr:MAG: Acetyltransferase, GNAT [Candidatus Magasanikbacteria bacterium GW2011_GWC2_37_14]
MKMNSNTIKIIKAEPKDVLGIAEVKKVTWLATYPNKKAGITIEDLQKSNFFDIEKIKRRQKEIRENINRQFWVAKDDKKTVGFCGAMREKEKYEIGAIYVLPEYQGQGIGKMFIDKAFVWLGGNRDIIVKVVSYNKQAINFYKTVGFKLAKGVKKSEWHKLACGKLLPEIEMLRKGVKCKLATINDTKILLKLNSLLDLEEKNKKEKISEAVKKKLIWVAECDKKIVGYVLVRLFDKMHEQLPNSVFLSDLCVLDNYRGQGIGRMLVQKTLDKKYPKQYHYFSLTHDPKEKDLTNFYKTFGFKVKGKTKAGNVKLVKNIIV